MTTPTTPEGLARYDDLPPLEAVVAAWTRPGPRPDWHAEMRERVRADMPVLARALDRAAEQVEQQEERPVPWQDEGSGQP